MTDCRTPNGEPERYLREVVLAYDGNECVIWPFSKSSSGYGTIMREGLPRTVSRLVCEEEHGPPPTPDHEAAHSCGKGHLACVTKRHLSWKTRPENQADKLTHGTHGRGERNSVAKLSEEDIPTIRALRGVMTQAAVAAQFGISRSNVGLIQGRKSWAWLE